jgi:hypothetical protein
MNRNLTVQLKLHRDQAHRIFDVARIRLDGRGNLFLYGIEGRVSTGVRLQDVQSFRFKAQVTPEPQPSCPERPKAPGTQACIDDRRTESMGPIALLYAGNRSSGCRAGNPLRIPSAALLQRLRTLAAKKEILAEEAIQRSYRLLIGTRAALQGIRRLQQGVRAQKWRGYI